MKMTPRSHAGKATMSTIYTEGVDQYTGEDIDLTRSGISRTTIKIKSKI